MKGLMAVALMLSMLAFGNTAGAGPFGVSMGEPIKPKEGWDTEGFGTEEREYEGSLPFDGIWIYGTREGGVCAFTAFDIESSESEFGEIKNLLVRKYGPPETDNRDSDPFWLLDGNPDKITMIALAAGRTRGGVIGGTLLSYHFENDKECNYPKISEL